MKKLALMAMIAMVMRASTSTSVVAHTEAKANTEMRGLSAGVLLDAESERVIDTQSERIYGTTSSDPVPIGNGRTMYLQCTGTGSPTVVLVSGFRGAHDDWTHVVYPENPTKDPIPAKSSVFHEVSRFTRVCAYDRPGTTQFGGAPTASSPVPQPTTADDGAADLQALLTAAHETGPFVVVGHSWGGLIARLFASRYSDKVVGLVLLDPGSEFLETFLTPAQWAKFVLGAKEPGKPRELEAAAYEPSVAALRAAAPVRSIPIMVLSSDQPFDFGAGGPETWPAWVAAQDGVASLLNARHITHTNSGHFIQGEQPKLVIEAIRKVVKAAVAMARGEPGATWDGNGRYQHGYGTKFSGLVPIGKQRKMYLECIGAGSPTVVFISGGFEAGWISKYALYSTDLVLEEPGDVFSDGRGDVRKLDRAVFPMTGRVTRVCNYDRPNTTLGDDIDLERGGLASTPVTQPHSLEADVADLRALLTAAKVRGPYVLVAHSYGGLIAELYARTYPNEVAGRVHIDVTNEFLLDTFSKEELAGFEELKPPTPGGERLLALAAMHSVRNAPAPPQKPVFLLSADKPRNLEPESLGTLKRVREAHDMLAAQLCAKYMKRTNSGHHLFAEQPQLVTDAVREVVEAVRKGCVAIPCNGVPPKTDPSITLPGCALKSVTER